MAERPLALLLELEKAELREALCDGLLSELESSETTASPSSKLRTGLMVEAMRLGIWAVEDDGGLDRTRLALLVLVGIEFTVSCEAGERVDREVFRPCRKPASFGFVGVVCAESAGGREEKKALRNMVSITAL